jgi:hypothetical protein
MRSNHFDNMILGANSIGQGSMIAVGGMHRTTLRNTVASYVRGLSLRLGDWRALVLKRAADAMSPAMAVCPSYSANRRQRHQRWTMAVVVGSVAVDRGPVGVC